MIDEILRHHEFFDRFAQSTDNSVDVIIPVIHTNGLWEQNLKSIYREIPVRRLLISDGGCIDDSIAIVRRFPRVTVFDHASFISLGYCIRKLIEEVTTEHFVYLHSDVYLTSGWFDRMFEHRSEYDWYESSQVTSFIVDIPIDYAAYHRPLSGGQLGRRAAFDPILPTIDDDFLYRNEDLILAQLVKNRGGRYGRIADALLYHQVMNKRSRWQRTITQFQIALSKSPEEEIREASMQARGLVKYLSPGTPEIKESMVGSLRTLISREATTLDEFERWMASMPHGSDWQKVLREELSYRRRVARATRQFAVTVKAALLQAVQVLRAMFGR